MCDCAHVLQRLRKRKGGATAGSAEERKMLAALCDYAKRAYKAVSAVRSAENLQGDAVVAEARAACLHTINTVLAAVNAGEEVDALARGEELRGSLAAFCDSIATVRAWVDVLSQLAQLGRLLTDSLVLCQGTMTHAVELQEAVEEAQRCVHAVQKSIAAFFGMEPTRERGVSSR